MFPLFRQSSLGDRPDHQQACPRHSFLDTCLPDHVVVTIVPLDFQVRLHEVLNKTTEGNIGTS